MAKSKKVIRKYYRKGRWSANIRTLDQSVINAIPGTFFGTTDLCKNPAQSESTVSQQYTVKNVELNFQMEMQQPGTGYSNIESLSAYIMYVPQGMNVTSSYNLQHPEYIMAMKFLGSPDVEQLTDSRTYRNPLKIKTRLARRLQTGDKIILLVIGSNSSEPEETREITFSGIIRWWTKAN